MLSKKIKYLKNITYTLRDEGLLGNIVLKQWELIVAIIEQDQELNIDKLDLLKKTEIDIGNINSENFCKRVNMLNQEFKDNNFGVEIKNGKDNILISVNDDRLNANINKQTAEFIKQSNEHNRLEGDKLITPKASSKPVQTKRQVLFSYSWEADEEELNIQRKFADLLENGLNNPPSQYKDSPKVSLFIDYKGFELGEDQVEQQDAMCQETPIAVICYTQKYLYSQACGREIDYYLTRDGNNIPHRRALVVPFDCKYDEMDDRFKKNLSLSFPNDFLNGLDFFNSASIASRKDLIGQLVKNIYKWFDDNPNPPDFDKHYDVKKKLKETGDSIDLICQSPEYLKGSTQQHQYEGAIDIVDFMYDWSINTTDLETRLFYLLGDFGSGKSTSCQMLTKKLMDNYNDKVSKSVKLNTQPVLPIYLDLKKLLNAFSNQKDIAIQPINLLLETMLSSTGVTKRVSGESIIQFINEYPCLLIFDGFDEVGQKLNGQQQTGLLNKLLEIFPKNVYQQDINRLNKDSSQKRSSDVPVNSRILISCRTHFFKNYAEQKAFHQLYYRHEAGISSGEIKNYQIYYLLPFTKEQIESYLINWLGKSDAEKALKFIDNVHDLSGLSERPLMLSLIMDLLPELQKEFQYNPHINASTLYRMLFDRVGLRDNEKHLIPLNEKRKLLGRFALYLWQQGITTLHVEALDEWLLKNLSDYPQLSIKLNSGICEPEVMLQDLHNASLLVRDNDDEYRFAHTSFFEFFVAVGIFDNVVHCIDYKNGFDYIFNKDSLSIEIVQFLLDWRLSNKKSEKIEFDKNWQKLQSVNSGLDGRKVAFDIWYFAYSNKQEFTVLNQPNWQNLKLFNIKLDSQSKDSLLELRGVDLSNATIEECSFNYIDFSKSNISNTYFRQNCFNGCLINDWNNETSNFINNRFNECLTPDTWLDYKFLKNNLITPSQENFIEEKPINIQQLINEKASSKIAIIHPDGKRILLGGSGGVSLWDVNEDSIICLHNFTRENNVISCEYSSDGTKLLIVSIKGVSIWKIDDDKIDLYQTIDAYEVRDCKFSPDGKKLIMIDCVSVSLWDVNEYNAICLKKLSNEKVIRNYGFSSDGTQIVIACRNSFSILKINEDEIIYRHMFNEETPIRKCKFSPDGSHLAISTYSGIKIWKIDEDKVVFVIEISDERLIEGNGFSPDSSQLVTLGQKGLSIWSIAEDKISYSYNIYVERFIRNCTFSPDSAQLVIVSHTEVSLWKINKDKAEFLHQLKHMYGIENCSFSNDGLKMALGGHVGASLWIINKNNITCRHSFSEKQPVMSCEFSPNSTKILTTGHCGASLWKVSEDNIICLKNFFNNFFMRKGGFSPDGTKLIVGGYKSTSLWDITDNNITCLYDFSDDYGIEICKFSPDGTKIIIGGYHDISLWTLKENNITCMYRFYEKQPIMSCKFSPDGTKLLIASHDNTSLWQINENNTACIYRFAEDAPVKECKFSPNGTKLIIVGIDSTSIWRVIESGITFLYRFDEEESITNCEFSSDGTKLVTVGYSGTNIWQVNKDNISHMHKLSNTGLIRRCMFSSDGTQLVIAGYEGISLWEITKSDIICLHKLRKNLEIFDIDLSSDNSIIAIATFDRIHLFSLEDNKIAEAGVMQSFNDANISYTDDSFTKIYSIQGQAWKYLYNKIKNSDNSTQILAPDTHPDWYRKYKDY